MRHQLDAIIFDLGNVLVDWNPRHLYRDLFAGDDAAMEDFLARVCTPDWHNGIDGGATFAASIRELSRRFPAEADLIERYESGWPQMFKGPIAGTVTILDSLAARGVPLYAISNFPAERYDDFVAAHGFMAHFRDVVVSGRVKLTKPDPRIYELAIARFAIDPARTLFIDDRADNVAAAIGCGLLGHRFTSAEELAADLKARFIV